MLDQTVTDPCAEVFRRHSEECRTLARPSEAIYDTELLTCLIAEGCNIGLRDMTVIGPEFVYDRLEEVYATYIREGTLAGVTATLVNFQLQQPLAQKWRQGLTSSSDARVCKPASGDFRPMVRLSATTACGSD